MANTPESGSTSARSALTFEEFVDAALGAAIKAAQRHGGGATPNPDDPGKGPKVPGGGPGPIHLPFPIWVGIVAGPFSQGGPVNLGNVAGGGTRNS